MATLQRRTNGGWELQFRDEHHRKQTITLSGRKYKERIALQLKDVVEVLVNKRVNNDPRQDPIVKTWVENAPPEIQRKLTRLGLYNLPLKRTVKELWDAFMDKKSGVTESTLEGYLHTRERFFMFFKPNEQIGALTQERMREWKAFLLGCGKYAEATVTGTITKAKAVFDWAKSQKWLAVNPLDGVGRGSYRNEDNDYFVTQEEYRKLLDVCPNQEWWVIITLARIGGLHPNEIKTLRWLDIGKIEEDRFRVFNAKVRQNKGLYERDVPLFPEVAVELDKLRLIPSLILSVPCPSSERQGSPINTHGSLTVPEYFITHYEGNTPKCRCRIGTLSDLELKEFEREIDNRNVADYVFQTPDRCMMDYALQSADDVLLGSATTECTHDDLLHNFDRDFSALSQHFRQYNSECDPAFNNEFAILFGSGNKRGIESNFPSPFGEIFSSYMSA